MSKSANAKHKRTVAIPRHFVDFLREVAALIEAGHEATTCQSDDLLQCDRAYGGLYDATNRRFAFRYFIDDEVKWDFDLGVDDISAL
jgi:hypothetical protein